MGYKGSLCETCVSSRSSCGEGQRRGSTEVCAALVFLSRHFWVLSGELALRVEIELRLRVEVGLRLVVVEVAIPGKDTWEVWLRPKP